MRKKTGFGIVALMTATVLLLSACGTKAPDGSSSGGDRQELSGDAAKTNKDNATGAEGEAAGGGKSLRIMVAKPSVVENMNTNETSKYLQEKTGVTVDYEEIAGDGAAEKVALTLAGGDLPDAFLNCGINNAQIIQYGIEDQALLPLDDLIEQYGANLKQAMEDADYNMSLLREVDGHIYTLPAINPCYHCSRALKMWINDEWLQKLGLSYPQTTDEFYEVLKAFKNNDPNGNGQQDEIPLTGSIDGWYAQPINFLFLPFLDFSGYNRGFGKTENGQIINSLNDERFREALRYIHKLYAEGFIYEGTLTQKGEQLYKLVDNPDAPLVGATTAGFGGVFTSEIGGERYRMYRPLAPLKGPDGTQYALSIPQNPGMGNFVITSSCKTPDVAMQWADTFFTMETTLTVYNGREGVAWELIDDDTIHDFNGNKAIWRALIPYGADVGKLRNDCWTQMGIYNFSKATRMGQAIEDNQDPWSIDGMEYMLHVTTRDLYDPYANDELAFPLLKFTADETEEITILRTEYDKYYDEMIFSFVTGSWDLDTDWAAHLKNLETYKVNELLTYYQTAYDRMYN